MSETVTMTLTDFLLARIADEEALARGVPDGVPPSEGGTNRNGWQLHTSIKATVFDREIGPRGSIEASPARVLAECEAKRRIVEEHGGGADPCDAHDASFETIPCDTLRALALPYADHSDFREEWRP